MGTTLRAELSEKNPYWIEKHRYYELKHFCLQYPIWNKAYSALDGLHSKTMNLAINVVTHGVTDSTAKYAMDNIYFDEATGQLMQSVTTPGGDVEQIPYKG